MLKFLKKCQNRIPMFRLRQFHFSLQRLAFSLLFTIRVIRVIRGKRTSAFSLQRSAFVFPGAIRNFGFRQDHGCGLTTRFKSDVNGCAQGIGHAA
jgi:hypothetical protein